MSCLLYLVLLLSLCVCALSICDPSNLGACGPWSVCFPNCTQSAICKVNGQRNCCPSICSEPAYCSCYDTTITQNCTGGSSACPSPPAPTFAPSPSQEIPSPQCYSTLVVYTGGTYNCTNTSAVFDSVALPSESNITLRNENATISGNFTVYSLINLNLQDSEILVGNTLFLESGSTLHLEGNTTINTQGNSVSLFFF